MLFKLFLAYLALIESSGTVEWRPSERLFLSDWREKSIKWRNYPFPDLRFNSTAQPAFFSVAVSNSSATENLCTLEDVCSNDCEKFKLENVTTNSGEETLSLMCIDGFDLKLWASILSKMLL